MESIRSSIVRWLTVSLLCLLEGSLIPCGYYVAGEDAYDTIRDTRYGKVGGRLTDTVELFYAIPFAAPPTGNRRFEAPDPPQAWDPAILDGTKESAACPQAHGSPYYIAQHRNEFPAFSEDCLYLNIYKPRYLNNSVPVLLFVHGGSNAQGLGALLHAEILAMEGGIVVVSFNYRLAELGFIGTGHPDFPGNYGILDQIAAFQWVKKNIQYFQGDPDQVTLVGHSAGAVDVALHLISPMSKAMPRPSLAKLQPHLTRVGIDRSLNTHPDGQFPKNYTGLFRRAIMMSGSFFLPSVLTEANSNLYANIRKIADEFGCKTTTSLEMKTCLKSANITSRMGMYIDMVVKCGIYQVVVDGTFLPDTPQRMIEAGAKLNAEVAMIGVTEDEGRGWINENDITDFAPLQDMLRECFLNADSILFEIIRARYIIQSGNNTFSQMLFGDLLGDFLITAPSVLMADLFLHLEATPVYLYSFNFTGSNFLQRPEWTRVSHGMELYSLFGVPLHSPKWAPIMKPPNDDDKLMSRIIIDTWSNFVKTGVPFTSYHSHQPVRYSALKQEFNVFGRDDTANLAPPSIYTRRQMKRDKVEFWNTIVPTLSSLIKSDATLSTLHQTPQCCDAMRAQWIAFLTLFILFFIITILCVGILILRRVYRMKPQKI